MNRTLLLLCGLALLVAAAVPGTALASDDDEVGICVVGVESPCNGPGATDAGPGVDGDDAPADNASAGDPIQFHPDELPYASGLADDDAPVDEDDAPASEDNASDRGDGDPIQFHPDELPYASGLAGDEGPESDRSAFGPFARVPLLSALMAFLAGLF